MRSRASLGHIFGINIRIDWSWLFIFLLIAWNLGSAYSHVHPEWGGSLARGIGILAAVLFFCRFYGMNWPILSSRKPRGYRSAISRCFCLAGSRIFSGRRRQIGWHRHVDLGSVLVQSGYVEKYNVVVKTAIPNFNSRGNSK